MRGSFTHLDAMQEGDNPQSYDFLILHMNTRNREIHFRLVVGGIRLGLFVKGKQNRRGK